MALASIAWYWWTIASVGAALVVSIYTNIRVITQSRARAHVTRRATARARSHVAAAFDLLSVRLDDQDSAPSRRRAARGVATGVRNHLTVALNSLPSARVRAGQAESSL